MTVAQARDRLDSYVRAQRLAAYGVAALSRRIEDAAEVARITGTSVPRARDTVTTGKVMAASGELSEALKGAEVSMEQATEIARAEASAPGSATELVAVAQKEPFHSLRDRALKTKLETEQHRDLAARQRAARSARSHRDALGMINIHLSLEPHVGTPIVARAEAEAARRARAARKGAKGAAADKDQVAEPFEAHLADAYAVLMSGSGTVRSRRPELVVLVSHEVAKRGWRDVGAGEHCKIPGIGPISPQVAKEIAKDAFLTGVFFDGTDLRNIKRWSRTIPIDVAIALELGEPPSFDGIACVDCGNRFRSEFDHVRPRAARGPTSHANIKPRCWRCHHAKTERDRRAGKLKPPDP